MAMEEGSRAPKRVLLLNASHNDERMLRALKALGCYVITTGNRPALPGHRMADAYCYGDYTDLEQMYRLARDQQVDAVCPCCNDFGVMTAAYVSERLGLPGQDSHQTTCLLHHKDRFKQFAAALGGIDTPQAVAFDGLEQALQWARTATGFPFIIKPVDRSAGKGVGHAQDAAALQAGIRKAFAASPAHRILVEPFLTGSQHGFCTFLIGPSAALAWQAFPNRCPKPGFGPTVH